MSEPWRWLAGHNWQAKAKKTRLVKSIEDSLCCTKQGGAWWKVNLDCANREYARHHRCCEVSSPVQMWFLWGQIPWTEMKRHQPTVSPQTYRIYTAIDQCQDNYLQKGKNGKIHEALLHRNSEMSVGTKWNLSIMGSSICPQTKVLEIILNKQSNNLEPLCSASTWH